MQSSKMRHSIALATIFALLGWSPSGLTETVAEEASLSCLWRVQSESTTVHLLGSVHALTDELAVLSPAMDSAFAEAELVVFEVDMDALEAEALSILVRASLSKDQTLADVVSPETLELVKNRLDEAGLPMAGFDRMKPWMLAVTLMSFEMLKAGFNPENGVDASLFRRAKEQGKATAALETVDFQLALFDDMPLSQQEEFLVYTINELDEAIPLLREITEYWRTGQSERLTEALSDGFGDFPELEKRLVTDRNQTWIEQVTHRLQGEQNTLFVVGALHLVGDEGLVEMLRAKGYEVEQL